MNEHGVGFSLAPLSPLACSFFSILAVGILIFSCLVNVEFVCAAGDFWTSKAPIPVADIDNVEALNGKIYAILSSNNAVYEYDPATDNWTLKTHVPTFRTNFAIATCEGKLYVIGGRVGSEPIHGNAVSCSVTEAYDPVTDSWEPKASMPTARTQMQAETVDGKIYVMGGRTAGPYTTVNITEVYDPATDTWARKSPMRYPVTSFALAAVDDRIYVIGGQDEFHPDLNLDTTQVYDTAMDNWTLGKKAPVVIWQAAAGATTGEAAPKRVYIIGGSVGFAAGTNQVYAYDPQTDTWTNAAPMPTARYNPNAAVVDNLIYVIGGGEILTSLSVNEQYTPIGYQELPKHTLLPMPEPSPSSSPAPTASLATSLTPTLSPSPTISELPSWIILLAIGAVSITIAIIKKRLKNR